MRIRRIIGLATVMAVVGLAIVMGTHNRGPLKPSSEPEFAKTSVMITSPDKHSGGSGVIIKSLSTTSYILTNKHVCQLVQTGGLVVAESGEYEVAAFKVYTKHDLCMIQVLANLHVNTALAENEPTSYETMTIAGHPALLPTIITHGHFANRMPIDLMVGTKPCDGTEKGNDRMMCMFLVGIPVIITLEAQPTSATIMPGSSGSGVFNSKGEVAGLVFAGPGQGIGYGFLVPYSYLKDFLTNLNSYKTETPDPNAKPRNMFAGILQFKDICNFTNYFPVLCKATKTPGIYHD